MTEGFIFYPTTLSGSQLDLFLERGCYRMGQGIFTTHFIGKDENWHRVFWLRYDLTKLSPDRKQRNLLNRYRDFKVEDTPLEVTAELEELFQQYKAGLDFEPAASVRQWLLEEGRDNVFDSRLITVRDGKKLIAAGVYDRGTESLAGILNFYDPAYARYSPGKYLMLHKIRQGQALGMRWYYPGYIVKDYPKFDYKLFAGKEAAELFIPEEGKWLPYRESGSWLSDLEGI